MEIKGKDQKIIISQGDSISIPFILVTDEGEDVVPFDESDKIYFVIQPYGDCCDIIRKEVTGISGTEFDVFVTKEESKKLCVGMYEYGVYVENGNNRLTLLGPIPLEVKRGL